MFNLGLVDMVECNDAGLALACGFSERIAARVAWIATFADGVMITLGRKGGRLLVTHGVTATGARQSLHYHGGR